MKNLYVFQINDDDGQQVLADNIEQARNFIRKNWCDDNDIITSLDLMGENYDSNHWENDHISVA